MNFFEQFPGKNELLGAYAEKDKGLPGKVNNHIHTPYSFSAFQSVTEAVQKAVAEDVRILGINDFYVCDGYGEFMDRCVEFGVFPLLNIELIGISKPDQENGIRVNDPANPGRTYISGKGLTFPSILPASQADKLKTIIEESNRQVDEMIHLLNKYLAKQELDIVLSVEEIMEKKAENLLRERHVAQMLRLKLEEKAENDLEFYELLNAVYAGASFHKKRSDISGTEEELRARLLKAGAPAFVPEDEKAFLPMETIIGIIKDAGGIPTYPLLLDGAGDTITEFEHGKEQLFKKLTERGFSSIEFIPGRNELAKLKEYAEYFYKKGFVISFGTEHNTSAMLPLTVSCKGGVELDSSLMEISYKGAAYVAAHQYLVAKRGPAYTKIKREEMENLGLALFHYYFNTFASSKKENSDEFR
jgi:PHP domain